MVINDFIIISDKIHKVLGLEKYVKVDSKEDQKTIGEEIVQDIFAKVDTNGDGKISKEEFLNACLSSKEMTQLLNFSLENHHLFE